MGLLFGRNKVKDTNIAYSMSKSIVRITGQVTETEDPLVETKTRSAEAVTELLTIADLSTSGQLTIRIPGKAHADTSSTIVLRDDRRVESIEAKFTGRGRTAVKAGVVGLGVLAAGVLAFVAPPIGVPMILSGALGAAAAATKSYLLPPNNESLDVEESDADKRFGKYLSANQADGTKLGQYRSAIAALTTAHAAAAGAGDFDALERLSKQLAFVRAEAAIYETKFTAWCLEQIKTTKLPIEPLDFDIDELPDKDELQKRLNTEKMDGPERQLELSEPRWLVAARRFGVAVSIDKVPTQRVPQPHIGDGEIEILYRPATDVTIQVWKVSAVKGDAATPVHDAELPAGVYYVTDLVEIRTARVVIASTPPVKIALDVTAFRTGSLKVTFNDIGEPKEIGGEATSQVLDTVAELGDNLKAGLETGSGIAAAVVPGSATAAYLERQIAIAKSRNELAPASADAMALSELKAAVELAELEARLRIARLNSLRTSGSVIISIGG